MKTFLTVAVVLLFVWSVLYPQSQIVSTTFYSASLGRNIPVQVYLPAGYSTDAAPYRLYVYLHGSQYWSVDLSSYDYATMHKPAFDAAIESGQIEPMVIVFPKVLFEKAQGVSIPGNRHLWTDSERNGKYESVVSIDLLQWIGTQYNVSDRRETRAIGGFHSGAIGAVNMAIRNSDKFIACASNLSWPSITQFFGAGLNGWGSPPLHFSINQALDLYWISTASAYSPNLVNPNMPELKIDFPIDEQGNLIRSVFYDQWYAKHDPATLMKNLNIYRQDVAFYNQLPVLDKSLGDMFDAELSSIGVPNTWYFSPIDLPPNFPSKEEMIMTLRFVDQAMDAAATSPIEVFEHDIRLMQRRDQITHFNAYINDIGAPQVWVQNTGAAVETNIAVECTLAESDGQQQMTVTVDSLTPLEAQLLTFNLRPEKNKDFDVTFAAKLPNDQNAVNDQLTLSMTASEVVDDFEKGNQQWRTNQDWGVSPASYSSGKFCMEDRPYLTYSNNSDTWAIFDGSFNLSTLTDAQLTFQTKHYLQKGEDSGTVEVSVDGGGTWTPLGEPFKNSSTKWHEVSLPLKAYCGQGFTNISIRFRLVTDADKTGNGWYVDDIYIKAGGTNVTEESGQTIDAFQLFNNYPNPFNTGTTISYTLATADHVTLTLYNSLGQQVVTLVDHKEQSGKHQVFWDGRDQSGASAASGVYVYSLKAGNEVQQKKLVMLK